MGTLGSDSYGYKQENETTTLLVYQRFFFWEHGKGSHPFLVYLPETDEVQSGKILYNECLWQTDSNRKFAIWWRFTIDMANH